MLWANLERHMGKTSIWPEIPTSTDAVVLQGKSASIQSPCRTPKHSLCTFQVFDVQKLMSVASIAVSSRIWQHCCGRTRQKQQQQQQRVYWTRLLQLTDQGCSVLAWTSECDYGQPTSVHWHHRRHSYSCQIAGSHVIRPGRAGSDSHVTVTGLWG